MTLQEQLSAYDKELQKELVTRYIDSGKPYDVVETEVHEEFRERYLKIIQENQSAPIFRIPYPS